MKRIKRELEKNKIKKMLRTKRYIIINSGNVLIGLMNKKTNKVYKPKYELFVEV